MSYILDALKKSDQERNRGQAPDLRTLHAAPAALDSVKPRWPYLLGLGGVFAVVAVLVWWQPWQEKPSPNITLTPPKPKAPRPVVAPPTAPQATVPSQDAQQAAPSAAVAPQPQPASAATPTVPSNQLVAWSDLPAEVRRGMPEMSFSVHLYSPKPAERMVSINGKMMKEGQEVSPGLKLLEIAPDGMVFSYQGYRFKRGVF